MHPTLVDACTVRMPGFTIGPLSPALPSPLYEHVFDLLSQGRVYRRHVASGTPRPPPSNKHESTQRDSRDPASVLALLEDPRRFQVPSTLGTVRHSQRVCH